MKKLLLILIMLPLVACVENPENRGYMTETLPINELVPGKTTKDEVKKLLGSPSTASSYGDETWYYISMKMVRKASFMPLEQREQHIVEVHFDKDGLVKGIATNEGEANRPIQFTRESTPTEGNSISATEQLLGNFGRFNKEER